MFNRAAGIPYFPIYNCHHTFATRLAAAGVPDAIIDQLLSHARRDILSHYTATVPNISGMRSLSWKICAAQKKAIRR
jgi:integrase